MLEGDVEVNKRALFTGALFSLVSSVSGQGYGGAINQTLNPESMEQVRVFYEMMGWQLAAVLAAPLLGVFVFGYFLDEWNREDYWGLLFIHLILAFFAVVLFPLVLLNL